jgi:hypothetical protein
MDGHSSHATPEFNLFCKEYKIIALYMPPYLSHLLQLLDISYFTILKRRYSQRIVELIRLGVNYVDKSLFLKLFIPARKETFTISNVKARFSAIGLVPLDPEVVLQILYIRLETPPEQAPTRSEI